MTEATCWMSGDLRLRSCQSRQTVFKARAVCSIVRCGFFPPEPSRLLGHEQHHRLAEDQVSQQSFPAPSLEVPEADLAFDQAEGVLHAPAAEGHLQQELQSRPRRAVGDEVFELAGLD